MGHAQSDAVRLDDGETVRSVRRETTAAPQHSAAPERGDPVHTKSPVSYFQVKP